MMVLVQNRPVQSMMGQSMTALRTMENMIRMVLYQHEADNRLVNWIRMELQVRGWRRSMIDDRRPELVQSTVVVCYILHRTIQLEFRHQIAVSLHVLLLLLCIFCWSKMVLNKLDHKKKERYIHCRTMVLNILSMERNILWMELNILSMVLNN